MLPSSAVRKLRKTNSRAAVLAVFAMVRADVTADACSVSLLIRVHASFYDGAQSDGNSAAGHLSGCDVWSLR